MAVTVSTLLRHVQLDCLCLRGGENRNSIVNLFAQMCADS